MRRSCLNSPACVAGLLFLFTLAGSSCRTSRPPAATVPPPALTTLTADSLLERVQRNQFAAAWLSAKAEVDVVNADGETTSFTVNLRTSRDSVVWMSVTPLLGIEAVRVLITRDSIYLLDRVHHSLVARDYRYLEDLLKSPVGFAMVQALMTGAYFEGIPGRGMQSAYSDSGHYVLSTRNGQSATGWMPSREQFVTVDPSYRILSTRISDDSLRRSLTVDYDDYAEAGGRYLPQEVILRVAAEHSSEIRIRYSKINTEGPLSFPFSVPEKYSRD
jgi:hypothetical protein